MAVTREKIDFKCPPGYRLLWQDFEAKASRDALNSTQRIFSQCSGAITRPGTYKMPLGLRNKYVPWEFDSRRGFMVFIPK